MMRNIVMIMMWHMALIMMVPLRNMIMTPKDISIEVLRVNVTFESKELIEVT